MNVKVIIEKWKDGVVQANFSNKNFYHFDVESNMYCPNIEILEYACEINESKLNYEELVKYEMSPETFNINDFLNNSTQRCIKDAVYLAYYNFNLKPHSYFNIHHIQNVYVIISNILKIKLSIDSNSGRLSFYGSHLVVKVCDDTLIEAGNH